MIISAKFRFSKKIFFFFFSFLDLVLRSTYVRLAEHCLGNAALEYALKL
jgi:hypothetical protein